jgi:hypothetical protein
MSQASQNFVSPNEWNLSGGGLLIQYSTNPDIFGGRVLRYQHANTSQTFTGGEVKTADVPGLGSTATVTLVQTVDAGSTDFTLVLPRVNIVQSGPVSTVSVITDGITVMHSGPLGPVFGQGQQDVYQVVQLTGTASHVLEA